MQRIDVNTLTGVCFDYILCLYFSARNHNKQIQKYRSVFSYRYLCILTEGKQIISLFS